MNSIPLAARFALFHGAIFLALGVYLPFWPVWLADRGLSESQVGLLLAAGLWVKVATGPLFGYLADRRGNRRGVLIGLAVASVAVFAGFPLVEGFAALLIAQLLWSGVFNAQIPIGESHTVATVREQGLDYGRVRLWGSLTFIAGTLLAGELLTGHDASLIHWLVLAGLAATVPGAVALPRDRTPSGPDKAPESSAPESQGRTPRALLADPRFLLFLLAAGLFQGSHAVYYGFSALHWQAAGLSESAVGWLWAAGVLAEVCLFFVSARLFRHLPALGLLALAGLAGLVRWTLFAETTDPTLLLLGQILHAGTFGAAHLGAMRFLSAEAPHRLAATAQAVYAAVSGGIVMGLSLLLAGRLFEAFAGQAFLAMAGLSLAGLAVLALAARAKNRSKPLEAAWTPRESRPDTLSNTETRAGRPRMDVS